jgi:hypothetical protein
MSGLEPQRRRPVATTLEIEIRFMETPLAGYPGLENKRPAPEFAVKMFIT